MRLGLLAAVDYTTMPNSDLDAAYAAAYAAQDSQTYTAIGVVIVDREATGFLRNLFGTPFPQFDAIQLSKGEFAGSSAAPQAVATSAGNLATTAQNALGGIGGTMILALASAAVVAWVWHFGKK
jgi:hypothetical protein